MAALALATGTVTVLPATAAPPAIDPAADRPASATPGGRAGSGTGMGAGPVEHWITLITGDAVGVNASGEPVRIVRGKGRENIPVRVERTKRHTLVVPRDARQLIDAGRVDERLFDITELSGPAYRKRGASGIRLIVGYNGSGAGGTAGRAARALKSELREDGTAKVRRTFPRLDAEAVTVPAASAGSLWETLTGTPGTPSTPGASARARAGHRNADPGLRRVSLDGVRKASLDRSAAQIGAPAAWKEGYDGRGVRIAVVDSGVDETHPDLAGRQDAEQNFSDAPDAVDRVGHGTHVASIAAGTGAKSAASLRGVAPGARILDAKVLDDDGNGSDSGVIAGIEWAAAQNADIVNLSLGGYDRPGVDPVEEIVNRLSAERGILFVAAAGNKGPAANSVDSPSSAEHALAVGAVDDDETVAPFSGRGPTADGLVVKPDVTAPGVGITAAVAPGSRIAREAGEQPPGYATISGTSMATPHVAGAAALLKQQHPEWTSAELKAALVAGTRPVGAGVFAEGAGRIDVAAAVKQTVVAEPTSVAFGRQAFPHADDEPVTKRVTYRNLGTERVTLDLSVGVTGPDGKPAPAGMFTLDAERVTLPAKGSADVGLTADTRQGGDVNGVYSATVTARGADQAVRTVAVVEREVETYDVTVRHIGPDGTPSTHYWPSLHRLSGLGVAGKEYARNTADGTYTARLPKGVYYLDALIYGDGDNRSMVSAPHFEVAGDTTVTLDARTAKPVGITGPEPAAQRLFAETFIELSTPDYGFSTGMTGTSFSTIRTAHLGPDFATKGMLYQQFSAFDIHGAKEYRYAYGDKVTRLATGFERHAGPGDMAEIAIRQGATVPGKQGRLIARPVVPGVLGSFFSPGATRPLPTATTTYVTTADTDWFIALEQLDDTGSRPELSHGTGIQRYEAGRSYRRDMGVGVFSPALRAEEGVFRNGDRVTGCVGLLSDSTGNWGYASEDTVTATLYRNGVEVASSAELLDCWTGVTVPAETGAFRLTASASRGGPSAAPVEVTADWTFRSGHTAADTALPLSVVRFAPRLDGASAARAGVVTRMPVKVLGAAAGGNLKSLGVEVSYDGRTWKKAKAVKGGFLVRNPAAGRSISLRAVAVDKQGNTVTQTVRNAYWGK